MSLPMVSRYERRSGEVELTGRTVTRIVASRATIREIIDKVTITRYSCFCGFHSVGTSLTASMSLGTGKGGFSNESDKVEVGLVGSLEIAIVSWVESFSDISKTWDDKRERKGGKANVGGGVFAGSQDSEDFHARTALVFEFHCLSRLMSSSEFKRTQACDRMTQACDRKT
jgi:hypothetical protein